VHFILRHRNSKNNEISEKHLKNPPKSKESDLTVLYTLIIRPDNSFSIKIDNETVRKGSLLTDMDPPINPPEFIDDPNDAKPIDWDDNEM
jgi:calnexin